MRARDDADWVLETDPWHRSGEDFTDEFERGGLFLQFLGKPARSTHGQVGARWMRDEQIPRLRMAKN
jgi:hypothetical protein